MPEPRISRGIVIKLDRLLDMMYKPSEIAGELGVSTETVVRSYVPAGAPVTADPQGQNWINGKKFAAWARECLATNRRGKRKAVLSNNQGYCLRCNLVVDMTDPRRRPHSRKQGIIQVSGKCPNCSGKVNRFIRESAQ